MSNANLLSHCQQFPFLNLFGYRKIRFVKRVKHAQTSFLIHYALNVDSNAAFFQIVTDMSHLSLFLVSVYFMCQFREKVELRGHKNLCFTSELLMNILDIFIVKKKLNKWLRQF